MSTKEATARIKINKLLEDAGWRFFLKGGKPANIQLEPSVNLTSQQLDDLGNDFEKAGKGFVDFLLLDARGFPLVVLEAKSEDKRPLAARATAADRALVSTTRSARHTARRWLSAWRADSCLAPASRSRHA